MGVDSLPPHGLHQLLIWSVDNYHFESQIVIWATSLLFVPETPAHFIRWAVIHLGSLLKGESWQQSQEPLFSLLAPSQRLDLRYSITAMVKILQLERRLSGCEGPTELTRF